MTTITRQTGFELLAAKRRHHHGQVKLSWSPDWPLEVTFHFPDTKYGPVTWVVSRDTLIEGLRAPAGLGDVTVLPDLADRANLIITLSSPYGRADLRIRRQAVREFLNKTTAVVPQGSELLPEGWIPEPDDPSWEIDPAWGAS
jgi:Streptomyces sporulation and cell division protein, SsgA